MPQLARRKFIEFAGISRSRDPERMRQFDRDYGTGEFPVLVFSDVHFQPFIPPDAPITSAFQANAELVQLLDAADTTRWPSIFQGSANAANSVLSAPGTDTNYALLSLALGNMKQRVRSCPAVLFTCDFLGHSLDQLYSTYSVNKTAAEAAAFVDKTLTFVLQQIRAAMGSVPVYFAIGNCDSYSGFGPDSSFLAHNARQLCELALNGAGQEQEVISTITDGGYYSVEPAGMNLMVIGLDTIALAPLVAGDPTMIAAQFAWFDSKLAEAGKAGKNRLQNLHNGQRWPGSNGLRGGELQSSNGVRSVLSLLRFLRSLWPRGSSRVLDEDTVSHTARIECCAEAI